VVGFLVISLFQIQSPITYSMWAVIR